MLRKKLFEIQMNLYQKVDGIIEIEEPRAFDEEAYEEEVSMSVKHEHGEDQSVDIKMEAEVENVDYADFTTEYLYNDVIEEDHLYEAEPFSAAQLGRDSFRLVKAERSGKKHYKRALCGLCGNSYYKDQLQRHIDKVHYKVKRFFCDLCEFGSFLKCNMQTHMGKHIAKEFREQILCSLCPATFTRHESLKNHMKTEHDENPVLLRCFCGKEFNLKHKLTTHVKRTHNNARDHACIHCPKKFFTPKELKMHILKNHTPGYVDKSDHYCDTCGKRYSSSKSLKTHMKHHKDPGQLADNYKTTRPNFSLVSRVRLRVRRMRKRLHLETTADKPCGELRN